MIRKKHRPQEENNFASFESYIQNEEHRRLYQTPIKPDINRQEPLEARVPERQEPEKKPETGKKRDGNEISFHFPLEKIQALPKEFKLDPRKWEIPEKARATKPQAGHGKYFYRYLKYGFGVLALFLSLYFVINAPLYYYRFFQSRNTNVATAPAPTPAPIPQKTAPTKDSVLIVPKLNVNAPIIFVNSIVEKDIKEGLRNGVAHYYGTAKPGENGNVFISGHSSNYWWEKGSFNYVFSTLDKLQVGDTATVYHNGLTYEYAVTSKKVVEPTDVSVLEQTANPTLTLMTCTPPGTDWRRLIVSFKQTFPEKNLAAVKPSPTSASKDNKKSPASLPSDQRSFWESITKIFKF